MTQLPMDTNWDLRCIMYNKEEKLKESVTDYTA